jgi:DNA-directed DNA polymerase III PolC
MFVHLRCHSHYSFLRAVPRPEELIAAAAEQACAQEAPSNSDGMCDLAVVGAGLQPALGSAWQSSHAGGSKTRPYDAASAHAALPESLRGGAIALTDSNGLYAAVPFYMKAREAGVKPIIGAVLDIQCSKPQPENGKRKLEEGRSLLLLAENFAGYSNLCQLVTTRHLEERPVTLEELNDHREGLIGLAEVSRGGFETRPYSSSLVTRHLSLLKAIFGDAFYLEAQRLWSGDGRQLRETLRLGEQLGVPVVATNNVHFVRPDEHLHHRVLNAVRTGALLSTVERPEISSAEAYFKSAAEMQRAFPDHPELLRRTLEIAERCNLELPLGKTIFPEFPVPAGETPFSYLWKLCFEGARCRYQPLTPPVLARLTHELEVIEKLNLAPYFLLVWDIVEEAKRRGIPAVARGSAASSMVTYCLGISRVCPLRWGLYFERFLNEQRGDIPDIDIDICGARRDELLDYVYTRWGTAKEAGGYGGEVSPRVAMIASFVTMHARLAIREVAKVSGVSPAEVNHFTRRLPHRPVREILQAIRTLPECKSLPAAEEPWKTILDVALRLDDFPRHLGIHPCGTVIAARPLTRLVPLEVATKGIVVTQYDMHAVEALGLIKMDLLGQRGLTTMSLALQNIEARNSKFENRDTTSKGCHPERSSAPDGAERSEGSAFFSKISNFKPQIDFDSIPEGDPQTCAMIAAGRTLGIFQIESPGMRGLLRALRAKTLDDICLALALIRPGAAEYGAKESFLRRLAGREPVRYPHPLTEPILRETLGICVYQEQVMQLAQVGGALSLMEADLVRRATAKFADQRERQRLHAKFLKAAERLGLDGAARDETWHMVEKFAGFGFCKAHAATYADLSYRIAYLKAHYPAEFLAAMCSSGAGFYHVSAYVEEAKRWGIAVRLPSVNHSRCEYTTEAGQTSRSVLSPAVTDNFTALDVPSRAQPFHRLRLRQDKQAAPLLLNACEAKQTDREVCPTSAMRIGLMQVKGLRAETIAAIVREREEHGAYRSLEDFLARVPVERDEIESLIKCGAFDQVGSGQQCVPTREGTALAVPMQGRKQDGALAPEVQSPTRPALLWRLNLAWAHRGTHAAQAQHAAAGASLFPDTAQGREAEASGAATAFSAADYTREQRLRYEQEILEVCVSGHPLDRFVRNGEVWSTQLDPRGPRARGQHSLAGQRVTLLGWVITFRRVGTKNYRNMMFVTCEDQRGLYEVVLFPPAYERYGGLVFETRLLRVTGRVEPGGQINCEKLEPLRSP